MKRITGGHRLKAHPWNFIRVTSAVCALLIALSAQTQAEEKMSEVQTALSSTTINGYVDVAPIQFVALVNTTDPASQVATGTLTGTNLYLSITVPPNTARIRVTCTSDGITPVGTISEIIAGPIWPPPPGPFLFTNVIPVPPIIILTNPVRFPPLITNLPGPFLFTNVIIPPPIILTTNPPPPAPIVTDPGDFASVFGVTLQPGYPRLLQPESSEVPIDPPLLPAPPPVPNSPPPNGPFYPGFLPRVALMQIELSETEVTCFLNDLCLLMFLDENGAVIGTAQIVPLDSDHDGVPDSLDQCPDTLPGSVVNAHGCSIDQLAPCESNWKNHGQFLTHFRSVVADFQRAGLIQANTARELNRAAAQGDCGK